MNPMTKQTLIIALIFALTLTIGTTALAEEPIKTIEKPDDGVDYTKDLINEKPELTFDEQIAEIEQKAALLGSNNLDPILAELQLLKNPTKEEEVKIIYLSRLTADIIVMTEAMRDSVTNFITYGVDDNTAKLGAGERAAVMFSYKDAYDKLPQDETELADAIKIANGRWPSKTSPEAEDNAKAKFKSIYKKDANMDHPNDNAAVTIMAYGLRQKAENRNLDSERNGIKIFKSLFNRTPQSTEDWNIMQAITYSGASR